MGGPQFEVDPEALDGFSRTSRRRGDDFDEVLSKVRANAVGRSTFGVMPASFELYERYDAFLDDCLDGLRDGIGAMADIAEAVDETRRNYTAQDDQVSNRFRPGN